MPATRTAAGVTFAVHDVTPASKPLPTCKTHEAVATRTKGRVESCCDYSAECVAEVRAHPLLAAVHLAFCEHRRLGRALASGDELFFRQAGLEPTDWIPACPEPDRE